MSDDAFLDNLGGVDAGSSVLGPSGGASCDYTNPGIKGVSVTTFPVTFDYEAWFTGAIDSASLALGVKNVNIKLLNSLSYSARLCDTLLCSEDPNISCNNNYNAALKNLALLGVSKNTTDIVQTNFLCDQPKPVNQLPIFDRIVCIPVKASILVMVPSNYTSTQVQTFVWDSVKASMAKGELNTANQAVGLVFTGTPHTTVNASGIVKKEMRPLGKGLVSAGCIFLFFLMVGLVARRFIKKRRNSEQMEDDDDLSFQKDDEELSFAPTESFISEDASPKKPEPESDGHEKVDAPRDISRKPSEVSRYSTYPTIRDPSTVSTKKSVKKDEPAVVATNDEEYEVNQFFCCSNK